MNFTNYSYLLRYLTGQYFDHCKRAQANVTPQPPGFLAYEAMIQTALVFCSRIVTFRLLFFLKIDPSLKEKEKSVKNKPQKHLVFLFQICASASFRKISKRIMISKIMTRHPLKSFRRIAFNEIKSP